jgi:hypothetical protein
MGHLPPPPHDPEERTLLTRCDGWEVRVFGETDFRHAYFARKSMLHLQLWHPERRVSVLTPSRLTADRWELYSEQTHKLRLRKRAMLVRVLAEQHGLRLPNPSTLAGLEFWFVEVPSGSSFDVEIRASC